MLVCIQLMVLLCICVCVCSVGVEGLMKSVSLSTCLVIPGGYMRDRRAPSTMCLWCVAWMSLKYSLLLCLVAGSGG